VSAADKAQNVEPVMDILLDPNLAYLLLVSGFMIAVLALVVPGTGLLELLALFLLVLTGWEVYSLPINGWALALLVLGVVPFLLAVRRTRRKALLAVSVASLVIGSLYLFRSERWYVPSVHPLLAAFVSLGVVAFFWIAVNKALEAEALRPAHDLNRLVGQVGETRTEVYLEGSVQLGSELWSARANAPIPAGTLVRVVGRDGFVLVVEPLSQETA